MIRKHGLLISTGRLLSDSPSLQEEQCFFVTWVEVFVCGADRWRLSMVNPFRYRTREVILGLWWSARKWRRPHSEQFGTGCQDQSTSCMVTRCICAAVCKMHVRGMYIGVTHRKKHFRHTVFEKPGRCCLKFVLIVSWTLILFPPKLEWLDKHFKNRTTVIWIANMWVLFICL